MKPTNNFKHNKKTTKRKIKSTLPRNDFYLLQKTTTTENFLLCNYTRTTDPFESIKIKIIPYVETFKK